MKRLASCANELKEMASDMDSANPGVQPVTNEVASKTLKLRKSDGNENCRRQMQENFSQDDHRLTDKDIQCSATSRWRSAVAKTLSGGGLKKSSMPVSSSFGSISPPDIKCVPSGKHLILESPAKLVVGVHSRDRYLFLLNDVLIIAKGRSDSNFRLKNKVLTSSLWVTSCSEKALVIGWPMQNSTFVFESSCLRDLWLTSLKDTIKIEKAKEVLQSIQIKIVRKDCEYTATKSLLVSNHETSSCIVERCLEEFHIVDATVSDFQLCVASTEDETTFVLSGHEYPFTIWMNSSQISAESNSDAKIQFVLRSNKKTNQRHIGENMKSIRKGQVLKRLFKRSSVNKGNVKLFGRELSELFEQDASIPYPIMEIMRKLYVDGPHTDGVFRKSANHTKLTTLKQSLNCGVFVNFDEIPVHLAAVLLKEFLRSLPNCLLNCQMYHEWMSVALITNCEEQIASIRRLVLLLPSCNRTVLRHLMCVLCNLARHSEECKMDAYNLAICIGQSVLWPGTSVVQKEDAHNANVIVQQMIDSATDIFGPDCLTLLSNAAVVRRPTQIMLRGVSADFDSQLDSGTATNSLRSSLGLEFTRSCSSEADYSPIVPDKDDFKMQSSQSCDSGLQFGEVLECQDMLSTSEMHMSANFEYFTVSESREEEEDCKHVMAKKLRHSKKILDILPLQQNSSLDTNSSLQSDDSVCEHSVESPLNESVDLPHDRSSLSFSSILPPESCLKASDFSPVVGPSKRMQFFQSMLQPPAHSFDMSLGQSMNMFFACDNKSVLSQKRSITNDSGVSFLGSLDKNYEESSEMECGRDVGGSASFSQTIKSPATDDSLENFSSTPFSCTRGCQSDQTGHRRPTLSELYGTSFSEKCLEVPEQPKEENTLEWAKRGESMSSNSSAFIAEGSSSIFGNCNLDKVFHIAHRNKQNPTCPLSSEQFWPVACMNRIAKESENRQLDSLPRRPLIRSNAVESDPENLKQGTKTAGPGHFSPRIKNFLHQSIANDEKVFKSHSSKDSVAENVSSMTTTHNATCIRREVTTKNSCAGFSAHEEMSPVKLRRDKSSERHSSSTVRNLSEEGLTIRQFIPHCKSLDNVSLKADSANLMFLAQNRRPSYCSTLTNETQTQDRGVQTLAEMNCLQLSKCKDISNNSHKARGPLSLDNKIDKTPAITFRSKQFSELRSYYDRCHEKSDDSLKACNAVSKSFSSSDYSIRPRLTRKHSKARFIRKRNSDPRLNVEGKRGSDLGRSKSDASEHCRNSRLTMNQVCSRRKSEVERSKENFTSLENILFQKKIERCGKAMSAKDLSTSMRNVSHHTDIVKRKSVTIKDRDWHKELARQYIQSAISSINISPSRKSGSSSTTYRFGREVDESVRKGVIDGYKCTGDGDLVPLSSSKSRKIGGNFLNYRLTGDSFDDGCKNTSDQNSKPSQNTCSISCSVKSSAVKSCNSTTAETSHLQGVRLSNTSVRELSENFLGLPLNSDGSKISDSCSKTHAAFLDNSDSLINKDSGRPLDETEGRIVDDSKILDPANISWSVARLKELYSNQDKQSGDRKIRTSHSKSEDWYLSKKSSTLPRLS